MDENIKDMGFEIQLKKLIADVVRAELTLFEQRLKDDYFGLYSPTYFGVRYTTCFGA